MFEPATRLARRAVRALGYDIVQYDRDALSIAERYPFTVKDRVPLPDITTVNPVDPLEGIIDAPEFKQTASFFARTPPWSEGFISADGLALLYHATRILRPPNIVEIGTYRGWTTQILARAADLNGRGTVHTVGPYDSWRFSSRLKQWPAGLQARIKFYAINSAGFFQESFIENRHYDLIFIDGNHDYEFALFDIVCAARAITPGGYIILDDAELPGVAEATSDFLAKHASWRDGVKRYCKDDREYVVLRSPA